MISKWKGQSEGPNDRLDMTAVKLFPELSRKRIKEIIDGGGAYVDKKRIVMANHLVSTGQSVELFENPNTPTAQTISKSNLIFANNDFIIFNKPAGLPSQATLSENKYHVVSQLEQQLGLNHLHMVHRLDKDTSGLMIIAKSKQNQAHFEEQFRQRLVTKQYLALCFGNPKSGSGTIQFNIAKVPGPVNRYCAITNAVANKHHKDSKSAETHYHLETYNKSNDVSLISCRPTTGRTHQIRVHLAAIGHSILGDKTYSVNLIGHPCLHLANRHMLHAHKIEFIDINGNKHSFQVDPPEDFISLQPLR